MCWHLFRTIMKLQGSLAGVVTSPLEDYLAPMIGSAFEPLFLDELLIRDVSVISSDLADPLTSRKRKVA